jgi:hypothetical protein
VIDPLESFEMLIFQGFLRVYHHAKNHLGAITTKEWKQQKKLFPAKNHPKAIVKTIRVLFRQIFYP